MHHPVADMLIGKCGRMIYSLLRLVEELKKLVEV